MPGYYLHDVVADNARWAPHAPALIFRERTWTWREFDACVRGLQRGLARQGVVRGSRVAVLDRNSDRYVFLHYALASLGAAICPINVLFRASEITYILDRLRPLLLVTSRSFRDVAGQACAPLENAPRFASFDVPAPGDLAWEELADGPDVDELPSPSSWDDAHMILFTSGTTGRPKGAALSHRRTVVDGLSACVAFGIRRGDRLFNYLPLFHTGAWDYLKLVFMNQGAAVLVEHFDADEAIRLVERHRCNIMFGVPVVLRKMLESPLWPAADMASMRTLAYGNYDSTNFLDRVLGEFRRQGASQIQALFPYGLTEGGPFVTIARPYDTQDHPNVVGTPLPGVSVILLDDDGREVAQGDVGEICVRSAALMSGYLDMPEATHETFKGGWMHTGDLGRIDAAGFLHVVDRKKDMIRTGGENVYAKEVEQLLISHPDVVEAAVVGLPDQDYGEKVVAAVIPRDGRELVEADVIAFVRTRIAGFKTPKRVVFLAELPRTITGKVAKNLLRADLLKAEVRSGPAAIPSTPTRSEGPA